MNLYESFAHWERSVPGIITRDSLWRMQAYRLALFASECGWGDLIKLGKDWRLCAVSAQLFRAATSISANIAEGYGRRPGRDRARFYEYALASARESRDWYYKTRRALGDEVAVRRMEVMVRIIRLLLTMITDQRFRGGR